MQKPICYTSQFLQVYYVSAVLNENSVPVTLQENKFMPKKNEYSCRERNKIHCYLIRKVPKCCSCVLFYVLNELKNQQTRFIKNRVICIFYRPVLAHHASHASSQSQHSNRQKKQVSSSRFTSSTLSEWIE